MEQFTIQAILSVQDKMSNVLFNAQNAVGKFTQNSQSGFDKAINGVSNFSAKTGAAMTATGAAITAFGVGSLKDFGSFEASLNKAAVVAGGTSKDIDGLADVANRMGAELPISAQDAANAMVEMARNGAGLEDIKKQFPAIAKASTAAGADLSATAGVVQQAMNIWGKSLKSPEQAASILVQTANMSNASIEDMQQALATVGPISKQVGFDMGTTSEAIGLLTNTGMSAAQAAVDLKFGLQRMIAPTKEGKKVMQDLGLSFFDAKGNMKPFPEILNQVADATAGMSKQQKIATLKTLYGTAGMQAMLPLLDSVKDKSGKVTTSWDAYAKQLEKTSGTTKAAQATLNAQAGEMQKNVGSKIEQVGGNWEALRNKSLAAKKGVSSDILDMVNKTLEWATTSDSKIAEIIRGFVGLSPAIGPVISGLGVGLLGFSGILKTVTATAKIGSAAIKGIGSAAGLIGKGVGLAGSKLFGFGKASESAAGKTDLLNNSSKKGSVGIKRLQAEAKATMMNLVGFGAAAAGVGAGVGAATLGLSKLVDSMAKLAQTGPSGVAVMTVFSTAIVACSATLAPFMKTLTATGAKGKNLRATLSTLGNTALKVGSAIGIAAGGFSLLINSITELSKEGTQGVATLAAVTAAISALAGVFAVLGPKLNASVVGMTTFSGVILSVGASVTAINLSFSVLVTSITKAVATFKQLNISGTEVVTTLGSIGAGVANMVGQFLIATAQAIPQLISTLISGLAQVSTSLANAMPQFVQNGIKIVLSIMSGITNALPQLVSKGLELVTKFIQAIAQGLPQVMTAGANLIVNFLNGIAKNLPRIITAATNVVVEFVKGVADNIGKVVSVGIDVITNFLDGMAKKIPQIINSVVDLISRFINGVANNLPKIINSAVNLIGNFLVGLARAIPKIADKAVLAVTEFVRGVGYTLGKVLTSGGTLIKNFIKGIAEGISGSREKGRQNGEAVKNGVSGVSLGSVGRDMVTGLWNGIASGWGWLTNKVSNLANSMLRSMKRALKIHSPSRVFRDKVGIFITQGIGVGMMKEESNLQHTAQSLAESAIPNIPKVDVGSEWTAVNSTIGTKVEHVVSGDVTAQKQPAYINVKIGNTEFNRFVEDISNAQGYMGNIQTQFGLS